MYLTNISTSSMYILMNLQSELEKQGGKKVMWDSFKATSTNSPKSTYGFQFRNQFQKVDPAPIPVYEASSIYVAHHLLVIVALDHYMKETINKAQLKSVPSTTLTMKAGRSVARTLLTMEAGRSVANTSLILGLVLVGCTIKGLLDSIAFTQANLWL
jgi:hypothetical protein